MNECFMGPSVASDLCIVHLQPLPLTVWWNRGTNAKGKASKPLALMQELYGFYWLYHNYTSTFECQQRDASQASKLGV